MAVLAIGLIAAGVGTMVFLRTTLLAAVDANVVQIARTDVAGSLFTQTTGADGSITFAPRTDTLAPDYFVVIYDAEGSELARTGGSGDEPDFPRSFKPEQTLIKGYEPFTVDSGDGGAPYRASVDLIQVDGRYCCTQLVAFPTAQVTRVVGTFLGVYSVLALLVTVAGALLTRWLVTLAFRSLRQVESTAMSIAAGDFSQRMTDIEPQSTEVGKLKTAINAMLGHVDSAISQRDATVRQMRRFIGDASHELRTPLVTVRGYAELYRMGAIEGETDTAQAMERIEKEAVRMGVLVEDLLALTRLDERRDVVLGPVDIRAIARDAAMDIRATSPQRTVTVIDTTDPDEEPPAATGDGDEQADAGAPTAGRRRGTAATGTGGLTGPLGLLRRRSRPVAATSAPGLGEQTPVAPVRLDPAASSAHPAPIVIGEDNRIRQVVANIVGNARRYTPDDSPIDLRIGVDRARHLGWIDVVDHGEGIPEQIRDKIFQRFWRADTSRTRETGGSGLGLSIVASIVESLHGSVTVVETPGGGATFRVGFPLAQGRDAAAHLSIQTQPLPPLGS